MASLLATMGRSRSKVGPESAATEEAAKQFQHITTEAERFKAMGLIRQLPSPMAVKLKLKEKLMEVPVEESHGLKQLKYENKKRWKSVSDGWKNFKYTVEPWGRWLRKVEGHHGTGVVSYFVFLRYLLLVNFAMFLLSMLIWVPEALLDASAYVSGSVAEACTSYYSVNVSSDALTLILDFVQGTGWMEKTAMFYGYYSGNGLEGTEYKLSLAYITVCIACLLISLILMGRHMASSFRESILNSGDGTTEFCNRVFGTWDFTLSDEHSAEIKHKSIRYELLSDMHEQTFLRDREKRMQSRSGRCSLYTARIIINIFVVLILGASGYLIYYITDWATNYVSTHSNETSTEGKLLTLLVQFLPSITIVVLNGALPIVFEKVVKGEEYTQAFVIKITLIRTVFLRLASLTVLMVTLYSQVTCSTKDTCTSTISPCTAITCWETFVGQNLYKLIVMDFLVVIVKTFLVELPRRFMFEKCGCGLMQKIGPPEFDLTANVLDIVYSQCLYWLSLTFAPLTPGIAVVKVIATFYMKLLSALKACPPPDQPYRASRSNAFFMIILLIAFFLCSVPVGYTFYNLAPSHGCGPFRTYDYMYYSITTTVDGWPSIAQTLYNLITSPAVTAPVIIFLILVIYYMSVLAKAHKSMSEMFREQLVLEGRDKQYLMVKIRELGGEPKGPPKPHRKPPMGVNNLQSVNEFQPAPRKVAPANSFRGGEKPPAYNQANTNQPMANGGQQANGKQQTTGISSPHTVPDNDSW